MTADELGADDRLFPTGVDFASRGTLVVVLVVWALSFVTAGDTLREAMTCMRHRARQLSAGVRDHRVLVSAHGRAFAWWQPRADGSWLLQEIAALPRGRGHGTRLLEAFLALADRAHAPVVLVCVAERVPWYARHGFMAGPQPADLSTTDLVFLHRPDPSPAALPVSRAAQRREQRRLRHEQQQAQPRLAAG